MPFITFAQMSLMNKGIFIFFSFLALNLSQSASYAQSKAERLAVRQLKSDITYLACDDLEGRRTGTEGERKAGDYIISRYEKMKIAPYKGQYRHPFQFSYGRDIGGATTLRINNKLLKLNDEAFPLPFSANGHVTADILPDIMEQGNIWLIPVYADQEQAENPHFEPEKFMFDRAKEAAKQGATGVVFYNSYNAKYPPEFNKQTIYEPLNIPVVYLNEKGHKNHIAQAKGGSVSLDLDISIIKPSRTGNNVAAYIDNHAAHTVIIGAHYDHLGYGEDENSRLANAVKEHQIHHGADDNASGTAAVLELAGWVKKKKLRKYNYLFLNFSGEELGLFGSKAFIKDQGIDSAHTAYMINIDMIGRLNDSTNSIEVGGIGTSPAWASVASMANGDLKVKIDSSGTGPSDHTSFYNAGIPVLFLFTGLHYDYHKPTDLADRINYPGEARILTYAERIIATMDKEHIKPAFTATKSKITGKSNFKVTLGIMPDYTFSDNGVRVDGVTDGRPAVKAGVKTGDVIVKLGDNAISGMQTYMEALSKFAPGEKTQVTIIRAGKEMTMPVEFNK
jgi:aminopeptidase YwaD